MKCPKCGYISFDHHDSCPKCKKNISTTRGQLNLPNFEIKTPVFLVGMAGQAGGAAGIPLQEAQEAVLVETHSVEPVPEAADVQRDAVPEQKARNLSIDFEDLTLAPDDGEDMIETVNPDQLAGVESEIDLAINNLEADDLLSGDDFEEISTTEPPVKKRTVDNTEENVEDLDLTLDLEDLELELELDGPEKKQGQFTGDPIKS